MAITLTVLSGQLVSSGGTLERSEKAFSVAVPSGVATSVFVEFATVDSAAPTGFGRLTRWDGTGVPFTVYSGAGPGYGMVPIAPTPFLRIVVTSGVGANMAYVIDDAGH